MAMCILDGSSIFFIPTFRPECFGRLPARRLGFKEALSVHLSFQNNLSTMGDMSKIVMKAIAGQKDPACEAKITGEVVKIDFFNRRFKLIDVAPKVS